MLRVLVADDESMARRRLQRLLATMDDVKVVGECRDGLEVLEVVRGGGVDVVLLDVQMPNLDGLAALRALGGGPAVVLVTAHPDHALAAFDGGATDYVLKPVDPARLRRALDRVTERHAEPGTPEAVGRLAVPTARGIVLVAFDAIVALVIDGESVALHTDLGTIYSDLRLTALEERLPPDRFLRVHRRGIVNLGRLVRLEPVDSGGYVAHLDDGTRVDVSRACARDLRRRWGLGSA